MSKPNSNPFFEADFSKIMDVTKMMGEFKVPGFNFEALMNVQRKNIEAFTALNQAAFESMQSLFRRQAELARQGFEETSGIMNAVMTSSSVEEKMLRQAEASKAAAEKCMANARDITETLAKCNQQAMETVSNRLSESMDELREIVRPSRAA
ncbi:MAG: phasin family protein [Alphaproteobacteria bacterium]